MGYFTWKDCQDRRRSVGYDRAVVICPDDTIIKEVYYEGYGIFGGYDIYELVVDWNRKHLKDIYDRLLKKDPKCFGYGLYEVAVAAMESDEKAMDYIHSHSDEVRPHLFGEDKEWKRTVGIAIACLKEDNMALPYPIKISRTKPRKPYCKLPASDHCQ